jgi:hypothetical protein
MDNHNSTLFFILRECCQSILGKIILVKVRKDLTVAAAVGKKVIVLPLARGAFLVAT